ncbi:MAG: aspartate aminotransferase family protein [Candidatus Omnitrophota bacterium]|nr:aspartate aminotransferase family protein [Candidatus Omnitrophota bacterium]
MNTGRVVSMYDKYIMDTYKRVPLCIEKAKGARVWDIEGKVYLDFFPGWAVSGIGHCHPEVAAAIKKQAKKLLHVSNNYYSRLQGKLAETIINNSFPGKVFFANSGAEANEAALKLARKYGHEKGRFETITCLKSFHGRTLGMITATGQEKVKMGFEPLPQGFVHVPFNDIEAVEKAITDKTIAIMLEPVQCEGGINIASPGYLKGLRALCDEKDIVLIFDEVQTGMGRSGRMFAFQNYGIRPDVMTLAKALGGGLPIGACVAREKFQAVLTPGTHASTFGGSPIVSAAALAVFDAIKKEKLLENANKMAAYLKTKLEALREKHYFVKEVRNLGLIIGVELSIKGEAIYKECMEEGLLINCTQDTVLRIMPPLTVTKKEIDTAIAILDKVFGKNEGA